MAQDRVFDTSALAAFIKDEPGADRVEQIIFEARNNGAALLVTTVNLGELWYGVARQRTDADAAITQLMALGIVPVDVTWEMARQAASFRTRYKLSFADCCAASLAKLSKLELVTCDDEFKTLEHEVKIRWLKGRPQ